MEKGAQWDDQEEEDLGVALHRRLRNPFATSAPLKPVNGNGSSMDGQNEEKEHKGANSVVTKLQGGGKSENTVYFVRDEGSESTDGSFGMQFHCANVSEKNGGNKESHFSLEKINIQKNIGIVINDQSEENLKDESPPDLNLLPSEKEHASSRPFDNGIIEHADIRLTEVSKLEVAEDDVVRVLEEQDTHDLYCPNCNSCITKRVILRKRKRKIQNICYDSKREKIETVVQPGTFDTGLDGSLATETNDQPDDSGPDMFRCLSCLSLFIPTGTGFKLFQIFGYGNDGKNEQNLQHIPARSPNWFNVFTSNRGKRAGQQETRIDNLEHVEVSVEHLNPPSYPDKVISYRESSHSTISFYGKTLVNNGVPKEDSSSNPLQDGLNFLDSSTVESPIIEKRHVDIEQKPEGAKKMHNADQNSTISSLQSVVPTTRESSTDEKVKASQEILQSEEQNGLVTSMRGPALTGTPTEVEVKLEGDTKGSIRGEDVSLLVKAGLNGPVASKRIHRITASAEPEILPQNEIQICVNEQRGAVAGSSHGWDILKSIIYGGLIESITSLGVVSSAAGGNATSLNIVALGLANLIGGLFVIGHNLRELKNDQYGGARNQGEERVDRYEEVLGYRENFSVHATVAVLSYLVFGLVSPVTYGFSFRKTDNKEYKLMAVAAVSLLCIILLATAKAHVQKPPKSYIKTIMHYFSVGLLASGLSYAAGELIRKLLEKLGLFEPVAAGPPVSPALAFIESVKPAWASY